VGNNTRDRILIVEPDPLISDLISHQALQAAGYQTSLVSDAHSAIAEALQFSPDIIICNLNLPGLSSKDLIVALQSQGSQCPVILLAQKGMESDLLQAFRLGVADFLLWPVREAEVIATVERVLRQVRERREHDHLSLQVQQANQDLQSRVRELTTIFALGKAVTTITDQDLLFDKILEGAVRVAQADLGWLVLREESNRPFILSAHRSLPASMVEFMNKPWDDGISSLVAMSGQPLSIHGDSLKRFKVRLLGEAALIMPVKVQKQVIGLIAVMRKQAVAFSSSEQHLLEIIADYAAISLMNAHLFRAVEQQKQTALPPQEPPNPLLSGETIGDAFQQSIRSEAQIPLQMAQTSLERLARDSSVRWNSDQRALLTSLQESLQFIARITEAGALPPAASPQASTTNVPDLAIQAVNRFQPLAQIQKISLVADFPTAPVMVDLGTYQIYQIMASLLSNAIKYCNTGGKIRLKVEQTPERLMHLVVSDTGPGIAPKKLNVIFEGKVPSEVTRPRRIGGPGIQLSLIRQLITQAKGKIWVESPPGQGASFHVTLPLHA
jgi:signal transduction histidine kinase